MATALTLEVLPAGFGDCLLLTCALPRGKWRMLVDTGPDETYPVLRKRLLALPKDSHGRRHIDLFVVTHIDHDHIGGAGQLLDDDELGLSFGDIWFNAPPRRATRGVREGESLAKLLGAHAAGLPWNLAWQGQPVVAAKGSGGVELATPGWPRLTVLSPTPERLTSLFAVWERELAKLRAGRRERAQPEQVPAGVRSAGVPDLQLLAHKRTSPDRAVPNGSSIAILLEHRGASVLLCGDAFANVLVPQLRALAERRGQPISVDALKLSHHGSRGNVTLDLLASVSARHHVISTNNAHFRHPDAEAMARVIAGSTRPVLWFNHDTAQNRRWADPRLLQLHGYEVRFPAAPDEGVAIRLPAR